VNIFVTVGGSGTRLKALSPKDKFELYYKNKKIIDWIKEVCPRVQILGKKKTNSRRETLQEIKHLKDVVIIDCDIIPFDHNLVEFDTNKVYAFYSNKNKYGSITVKDSKVVSCSEKNNISNIKCSGIYCIKDMQNLLDNMKDDNSIISGMIGADVVFENTFLRFGDVEDYYESIQN